MARARNLKPGFFKNEDLAECSPWARLCFAGLWTLADREGRLEDRPKRIKGELFAFDSVEVDPLLNELERGKFIHRYKSADGRGVIQVLQFLKHQNPHHREPESDFQPPQSPGFALDCMTQEPEALPTCNEAQAQGKPEALPACEAQEASYKPEASPGLDPPNIDLARGSSRAESLLHESLLHESSATAPKSGAAPPRKRVDPPVQVLAAELVSAGFDAATAADFIDHKRRVKAPLTKRAWEDHLREARKAGITPKQAAEKVMAKGWKGFEASYVAGLVRQPGLRPATDDIFAGAR